MRIVVAYKWTCDPEEATVRADGTVDWGRAKPGISTYDPVAMAILKPSPSAPSSASLGTRQSEK